MHLENKRVLVLGLGDTGLSAVRWLKRKGAVVRVADSRVAPPHASLLQKAFPDVQIDTGCFKESSFQNIDLIVSSPGIPVSEPMIVQAHSSGIPVVGDVELFAQAVNRKASKIIAITGSNGKSTVTSMVGVMCKKAGLNTVMAGNIGLPVLDALLEVENSAKEGKTEPDVYVLELSSFQLETTSSLNADAAAVLNVSEDHLDRYTGMQQYADSKAKIFQGSGVQILNREDSYCNSMTIPGRTVKTFGMGEPQSEDEYGLINKEGSLWLAQDGQALMSVKELPVAGMHNAANALAALALCRSIGLPFEWLLQGLKEFSGLPHRVEWVLEIGNVNFYDDSKGTNVGATEAALNGMTEKVVLIAGGDGKGQDFSPLKAAVANHARAVVLIGRDGDKIKSAISGCDVPVLRAESMDEAVRLSFTQAKAGDAVMLSPACASFDMFRNYEHRAHEFVRAAKELKSEISLNGAQQ